MKLEISPNPIDGIDDYLCPACAQRHSWRSGERIGWRCGTVAEIDYKTEEATLRRGHYEFDNHGRLL